VLLTLKHSVPECDDDNDDDDDDDDDDGNVSTFCHVDKACKVSGTSTN